MDEYVKRTPTSGVEAKRAQAIIPGGVGSAIQFWPPYPIFVKPRLSDFFYQQESF